jgi:GGDEF domain-containing protein
MISLKTYLFRDSDEGIETSYRRMLDLFIQAISLHAVEGDKTEYERFRADMAAFSERSTGRLSTSERFILVGEILRALEDYNRHTTKFLRIHNAELQKMINMLTQTVIAVGASSVTSAARLKEIEKTIEQARILEDIHSVKAQLGECLNGLRGEAERQKSEGQLMIDNLQQELAYSKEMTGSSPGVSLDSATGLPDKSQADRHLREAVAAPEHMYLLIAVVNRVQAVNARFGYTVGDRVLAATAEHFRGALSSSGDRLFRWQGPCLLALLNRNEDVSIIRSEIRRFAEKKIDKTFVVGSRSVLLPISTSWTVLPVAPPLDALLRKIEIFTAAQVSHDYV